MVGAFAVIWSLSLCRNGKVFNDKNSSLMPVYGFTPFMVAASAFEGPRPFYNSVYMVGEFGQGVY
jgi:hypothetical protein